MNKILFIFLLLLILPGLSCRQIPHSTHAAKEQAVSNSRQANEAFIRSQSFVNGWLRHGDPLTGLTPRTLKDSTNLDIWNA